MIGAYKCLEIIWVPKHIWEDNTKTDIKGKICVYMHICGCVLNGFNWPKVDATGESCEHGYRRSVSK
jgi:hypothetical protein